MCLLLYNLTLLWVKYAVCSILGIQFIPWNIYGGTKSWSGEGAKPFYPPIWVSQRSALSSPTSPQTSNSFEPYILSSPAIRYVGRLVGTLGIYHTIIKSVGVMFFLFNCFFFIPFNFKWGFLIARFLSHDNLNSLCLIKFPLILLQTLHIFLVCSIFNGLKKFLIISFQK
jgi:hypothetical protein